ncbi:MAG: glycine cleavage system protein GcvH [Planctomycetota bacterium]|nr:MAG: glycine cleavage system protein GcvH [Planctomycetota bacterium]
MAVPQDRKYAQTHEWFKVDGNQVTIGITQFAADELTDITYVELPEVGSTVTAGAGFGEVESVKATSEMYSALSGTVVEVNTRLADEPELVNNSPFDDGWMIRIECDDLSPLEKLMDAEAYEKHIAG